MNLHSVLIKLPFLIFPCLYLLSPATDTHAKPVAAIIYPNEAKITEHLTADVESNGGRSYAKFFLPVHARKETLSISTKSNAEMEITSVNIEEKILPLADQVATLKDRLKELNRKKSEFETRIKADTAYIEFWQTRAKNPPEKIESIDSVEKLGSAIKKGIIDAYDEIYQYNQSLESLSEQIAEIEKQINDLTGAAKKRWQVTVDLTGNPQPKIDLICSYHIQNCGWHPTYTINALPARSEVELDWFAEITQNTGIDWENVELRVATSRTVTRPEPPLLRDWIIQPRQPIEYSRTKRTMGMAKESLVAMAPQMSADMAAGATPEPEQEAGFSFDTYDLGMHGIHSGDSPRYTIRKMVLNADFKYMIRPQVAAQAFLFARINVQEDNFIRLPKGEATFMVDSAFIANQIFSMYDPEQKLFFGSDPQVGVKLTTLKKKSDETGFLIGNKKYQWGWKVSVNNLKSNIITVLMEDAYPQIRDDRIKLKASFKEITPEKEDNMLKWIFPVPPLTETALEYGFTITYPDDMDLSFGGR